jgi:hypothetical protein
MIITLRKVKGIGAVDAENYNAGFGAVGKGLSLIVGGRVCHCDHFHQGSR